jgi:hypothetical protein
VEGEEVGDGEVDGGIVVAGTALRGGYLTWDNFVVCGEAKVWWFWLIA